MEWALSVDEILDSFLAASPSPAPTGLSPFNVEGEEGEGEGGGDGERGFLNQCASDWFFDKFLQVSEEAQASTSRGPDREPNQCWITKSNPGASSYVLDSYHFGRRSDLEAAGDDEVVETRSPHAPQLLTDPGEYQAILKKNLDLLCATVALSRGSCVNAPDLVDNRSPTLDAPDLDASKLDSQISINVNVSELQHTLSSGLSGIPALSLMQNTITHGKPATSNSSREPSDDEDELEGEAEMNDMDPSDVKRQRRMLSNRESARRSRRRKQAHMSELELQVSQLRLENSSLLNYLTDANKKFTDATVNNRIIKADLEALRAKVKMAEESVKRATRVSPMYPVIPDTSNISLPATVPVPGVSNRFLRVPTHIQGVAYGSAAQICRSEPLQRVVALEHLQKTISGGPSSCSSLQWKTATWSPEASASDK